MEVLAESQGVALTYKMQIDSIPALKAMVASGMGCAVLPKAAAIDEIRAGTLDYAEITDPVAPLELVVGLSHLGKVSKEIYQLCDIMRDHIDAQIKSEVWHATLTRL